jgi:hypothetical protein
MTMTEPVTWHLQDNHLQHISNDLNGWSAQIWDFGSHPSSPPHPDGKPFNWSVSPSMALADSADREGYTATLDEAKYWAELHLQQISAEPAPRDDFLVAFAKAMGEGP